MKSNIEKVYSRLPKTELAKVELEKVELGIAQDLEKKNKDLFNDLKKADESWKNYQDYLSKADKPFKEMIKSYNKLSNTFSSADTISKQFIKAAKELGVDVKNNKDYKNIEDNLKTADDVFKTISSFKDPSSFQ